VKLKRMLQLILLAALFEAGLSVEMTFTLQEHEVQCFHEIIPKDKKFSLEYQVISGGHFDIDCNMMSPNSKNLYKETRKQYDTFHHKTVEAGEYTFCFSNEFSTFAHKTVYFDLDLGDESTDIGADAETGEGAHATALTQLESSAYAIHESLRLVVDYQNHHRLKERIGREIAEYLCERVQNWSIGQTALIVVVAFGQVFMLRKLFDKPAARGGKVGI